MYLMEDAIPNAAQNRRCLSAGGAFVWWPLATAGGGCPPGSPFAGVVAAVAVGWLAVAARAVGRCSLLLVVYFVVVLLGARAQDAVPNTAQDPFT